MKKLTQQEFEDRVYANNQLVSIIGAYQKYGVNVECQCNFCGQTLWMEPSNLIAGKGCYRCSKLRVADSQRKTTKQFVAELKQIQPTIVVLGEYTGSHTKIECLCALHNCTFEAAPTHLLGGETGCAFCIAEKLHSNNAMTRDEFVSRLEKCNPNVELLSEYYNRDTPVSVKCKECGYSWQASPAALLVAHGCRRCYRSVGESIIHEWLDQHSIPYECQKKYPKELRGFHDRAPLSFDFFLPNHNTLIEYQGQFHDGTAYVGYIDAERIHRQQESDRKKREYALEHGIKLIEIWYYQRDRIPDILSDLVITRNEPVTTTG